MGSISAMELEVIDEVAYVGVAEFPFVSVVAQVFEDLPLEKRVVFSEGFCAQDLESTESIFVILSEASDVCQRVSCCVGVLWDVPD